uniref:Uncharacterized protein n=1 Tax=Tetranychus urticae TaxID=32264 RepID=T1K2C1_TETUR
MASCNVETGPSILPLVSLRKASGWFKFNDMSSDVACLVIGY